MSGQEWRVSRATPGCYIFLLDQSYSMNDPIGGSNLPKSEALADAINRFISSLIAECEKGEATPRHFFDVAVIGYRTDEDNNSIVGAAFQGPLASNEMIGMDIVSIVHLAENQLGTKLEGGIKVPIWYKPVAEGGSPMCAGLEACRQVAAMWAASQPDSVPPIIIHITDGEATDGNPEAAAQALQAVRTQKGSSLLFNVHLSDSPAQGILFPNDEAHLPDPYAQMLFRMSSELPDFCRQMAQTLGYHVLPGSRGMAFNTDGSALSSLLAIGTLPTGKGRGGLRRCCPASPRPALM